MYKRDRIAVTGIGLMTSSGRGCDANWRKLIKGQSGVQKIERFSTHGLRTTMAATVESYDHDVSRSPNERTRLMLNDVFEDALSQAAFDEPGDVETAAVYVAVPGGEGTLADRAALHRYICDDTEKLSADELVELLDTLAHDGRVAPRFADLQQRYRFRVPPASVSTACASGATAIQLGVQSIRRGDTHVAIAAAADSTVYPEGMMRFSLLSALSRRNDDPQTASRPFDRDRDGFVMGEGAGALVLEQEQAARDRGATILGFVRGCGDATDNFHRTRSDPSGCRIKTCVERALADADLVPEQISAVNAHGTSTPENDKMEALGLNLALGKAMNTIPVSSSKSMIGHTLAAAGIIEAIISLLSLKHKTVPPSANIENLDEALGINVATSAIALDKLDYILSNSFGFGGQNVSLILESASA